MQLKQEQIDRFIEIHKEYPEFEKYSETEIREIANGVANYYLTLFRIYRKSEKDDFKALEIDGRG